MNSNELTRKNAWASNEACWFNYKNIIVEKYNVAFSSKFVFHFFFSWGWKPAPEFCAISYL